MVFYSVIYVIGTTTIYSQKLGIYLLRMSLPKTKDSSGKYILACIWAGHLALGLAG